MYKLQRLKQRGMLYLMNRSNNRLIDNDQLLSF